MAEEKWVQLSMMTPKKRIDLLSGLLSELGCAGLITRNDLDPNDRWGDEADSELCPLHAFFLHDPQESPSELADRVEHEVGQVWPQGAAEPPAVRWSFAEKGDWEEKWKNHFTTTEVGDHFVIVPSWEESPPSQNRFQIRLDPGAAFGRGTHASTQLSLRALSRHVTQGDRVLDAGTGSGILAVAAAQLGAKRVLALDVSRQACREAKKNAELNGVKDQVVVRPADLRDCSWEGRWKKFDVVVANLTPEIFTQTAAKLGRLPRQGGVVIASGVMAGMAEAVKSRFLSDCEDLSVEDKLKKDGWVTWIFAAR